MKINGSAWTIILMCFWAGGLVFGQVPSRSFDEVKKELSLGDTVRVTDDSGNIINGKVEELSSSSLKLKGKTTVLFADSIRQIQKKRRDSVWNGLLIGGGIGAASGLIIANSQCRNDSECSAIANVAFVPAGLVIGLVTGALIDRSMTRYDTVFSGNVGSRQARFHISPIISQKQKGLVLSIAF